MKRARLTALVAVALGSACSRDARADDAPTSGITLLPGAARGISRSASASRDAAVFEYAFGPRAQASIGIEPGLVAFAGSHSVTRIGFYSLIGLENANSTAAFPPSELWRELFGLSLAVELPQLAHTWLTPRSDLELGLTLGHEGDYATGDFSAPPLAPRNIPFGGGGNFIAPDVAVRLPVGRSVSITMRLTDRIYFNELPLLVGARAASDVVADDLHEGLQNAASADLIVRWRARAWVSPQLALFGEHEFSHDAFGDDGGFFRAMASFVFPGKIGEIAPFYSFDAGNGVGLLINRRELRSSLGIRYAFF